MKLYSWGRAPNPRRVVLFAAEKNIDLELVEVGEGSGLSADYLARVKPGTVPALELDDGTLITEAMAICRCLEELHPQPRLLGTSAAEMGLVHMWEHKCELDGIMAVGEVLRNKSKGFANRGLSGYTIDIPQVPELIERGKLRAQAFFHTLEGQLRQQEHVALDSFSMADITALCAVDFALGMRMSLPEDCPRLAEWHKRVSARPAVAGGA